MISEPLPLMTMALMTWNHEQYVEAAVRAALAQDYSPLEIVISDDASTDGTWAIVERVVADYRGPHQIHLNRNLRNLGVGAHNDAVMDLAQGRFVVLAAGDDISESDRVTAVAGIWLSDPERNLCVASLATCIDASGTRLETIAPFSLGAEITCLTLAETGEAVLGATLSINPALFEHFGSLGGVVECCEDIVLPFRAALLGRVHVIDRSLVRYRVHPESLMGTTRSEVASKSKFLQGIRRISRGQLAARRHQLADLAKVADSLPVPLTAHVRSLLEAHCARSALSVELLSHWNKGWPGVLRAVRTKLLTPREAIKTVALTKFPGIWLRYLRWRAKALFS